MVATTTAWVDLVSPSHPFFFASLLDGLDDFEAQTTVRDKTETVDLAQTVGLDFEVVGKDFQWTPLKVAGYPLRTAQLIFQAPSADIAFCSRNPMCVLASKARRVPCIHFTDNDITAYRDGLRFERQYNRLESMATYNVVPEAFQESELTQWHASPESVRTYDGYKEDIYVSGFEPDPGFLDRLPFEDYVVVRPEALDATYVDAGDSLVPELLERCVDRDLNVVYLPRMRGDADFAADLPEESVYTPEEALDGLQLSWHATCVLTGSGTMAREAACMSKPAVSFFPNTLLSVDQQMVAEGRVLHSRDVDEIIDYISSLDESDIAPNTSRSEQVKEEVLDIVRGVVNDN